jgi:predicted amidophosphoribosyltransferase
MGICPECKAKVDSVNKFKLCEECYRKHKLEWAKKNREKLNEYQRKWYHKNKNETKDMN